jgi:hypothetical protein
MSKALPKECVALLQASDHFHEFRDLPKTMKVV